MLYPPNHSYGENRPSSCGTYLFIGKGGRKRNGKGRKEEKERKGKKKSEREEEEESEEEAVCKEVKERKENGRKEVRRETSEGLGSLQNNTPRAVYRTETLVLCSSGLMTSMIGTGIIQLQNSLEICHVFFI